MPHMNATMLDRITERRQKLGKSERSVSIEVTGKPDLIRKLRAGESKNLRSDNLMKLAEVLKTSPDWLLKGEGPVEVISRASEAIPAPVGSQPPAPHAPSRYIPVYGLAAGSVTGMLTMSNDPIEEVPSPEVLARVRDAYALIVTGTSMEPRYTAGDYVFVHPHKPIRQGDHVVIQELRDGGTVVSIKRFERFTDGHVVTTQYNPLAEVKFLRTEVAAMHRVLTPNEVAGV